MRTVQTPIGGMITSTEMEFRVEREMDQHWYRVEDAIEATSAGKAVESCAKAEGTYSARPAATPDAAPELFAVPSSGSPSLCPVDSWSAL